MKSLFSLWTQIFKVIVVTALLSTRASNGAAKQEPAFQEKGKIFAHGIVIKLSMTPGKSV
jgi:hypothetical protein